MPFLLRLLLLLALGSVSSAQLDLPDRRSARETAPRSANPANPANAANTANTGGPGEGRPAAERQALVVLEALGRGIKASDVRVGRGVGELRALGEPGRRVAREFLESEHPAALCAAVELLCETRELEDLTGVAQRLQRPLPDRGGPANFLLTRLLKGATQPGLAEPAADLVGPRYLVGLLEHPDAPMRAAARHRLRPMVDADTVPLLRAAHRSERSSTRIVALELVATAPGEAALNMLLESLGDGTSKVAAAAAELLARRQGDEVGPRLRATFSEAAGFDRRAAFALLALLGRAPLFDEVVLEQTDVPVLLIGLRDMRPLVAASCACALAHLGFRSESRTTPAWLHRDVPHALVKEIGSEVFHRDYSVLRAPVQAALEFLTGERHGANGSAWLEWWGAHAEGFEARRGRLPYGDGDAAALRLRLCVGPDGPVTWLLGPDLEVPGAALAGGREQQVVFLGLEQADACARRLEAEGVLGLERPPAAITGSALPADWRGLEVVLAHGRKRVQPVIGTDTGWFDRLQALVEGLAQEARWQRWYDTGAYGSAREAWLAEREAWGAPMSALERARRLKDRVLRRLEVDPSERGAGLRALERLARQPGVFAEDDLPRLLLSLRTELAAGAAGSGADAGRWVTLLFACGAGEPSDAGVGEPIADPVLPLQAARELFELLLASERPMAPTLLRRVLMAAPDALVLEAAADSRPAARRAAAAPLAERVAARVASDPGGEGWELLRGLLQDEQTTVACLTMTEAGEHRLERARPVLLALVEHGEPERRAAALVALGRIGGEGVLERCQAAALDPDEGVRAAALAGVAELADPRSASWLGAYLARGPGSPLFEPARRGLERLGLGARNSLLDLLVAPRRDTRRAAALILARAGDASVTTDLLTLFTEEPRDDEVAKELAVQTGFDGRASGDPVRAWWTWWDGVPHDDPTAWLLEALRLEGWGAATARDLEGTGTRDGAQLLLELCAGGPAHLRERARRDLGRLLSREVSAAPAGRDARSLWYGELRAAIDGVFPE